LLKKTITYEDFNGETVSEDFYFNLSKAELVEIELSHEGGLVASIQKIVETEDGGQIIKEFKNIIMKAYGKKSADGRRFIKNERLCEEFGSTEAYSVLFMELVTDADAAVAFINGVVPAGLAEDAAKAEKAAQAEQPQDLVAEQLRTVTRSEFMRMSSNEAADFSVEMREGKSRIVD
jgi:hypothetical protein